MDSAVEDLFRGPGDAVCVVDAEGAWSRGEVRARTASLAAMLRARGVAPGDRVAVVASPCVDTVAALLAARVAGAIACPVDAGDPERPLARLSPRLVVSRREHAGHACVSPSDAARSTAEPETADGGPTAWAVETSGSSGGARFVALTAPSVAFVTAAVAAIAPYFPDDRVVSALPLHHTYGLSQLWLALRSGAALRLPPQPLWPGVLAEWVAEATVLPAVPALLRDVLSLSRRPALRLVTLAGQSTPARDRERFQAAWPAAAFVQFYGLTEATTRVLWLPPERFAASGDATGVPLDGVRAWLEDDELFVEGPNVSPGYLDDAEATARRFPRPGVLATGDLFRQDGASFAFVGRRDGVWKRRGEKVVPERIEAALEAHPAVERALVLPEEDGAGELGPAAWVVARGAASEAALLAHLRGALPSVLVPLRVRFVASQPTTASGKLVRAIPDDDR